MQIQAPFGHLPLSSLRLLGLKLYTLIPDFRRCCPLCGGAECAVRHGLFFRQVVDLDGSCIEKFPIPRFRCRRRGQHRSGDATFSVLPLSLVSRRRLSLPLMLRILTLLRRGLSVPQVLDRLAAMDHGTGEACLLEEVMVYRVLALFARAHRRLQKLSAPEAKSHPAAQGTRDRALAVAGMLGENGLSSLLAFHYVWVFFPEAPRCSAGMISDEHKFNFFHNY